MLNFTACSVKPYFTYLCTKITNMKKAVLALCLAVCGSYNAFSQITIAAADMPIPPNVVNIRSIFSGSMPNPTAGTSAVWDYGIYGGALSANTYNPETDVFFTSVGVDVNVDGNKSLSPTFGYTTVNELDFNATAVQKKGMVVPAQSYDLSAITGSTSDTLSFPLQKMLLTTPKTLINFPCTFNASWTSNTRSSVNFYITYTAGGLTNTPGKHVYYTWRKDTIVGWGKARVYTPSGASRPIDVLMGKISEYSTDSFYLNGSPAPTALLTTFGVTQGQHTDSAYKINFYRKGHFNYLLSFVYYADYSFTTSEDVFAATDSIVVDNIQNVAHSQAYTTVLFPNPCTGNELSVFISNNSVIPQQYVIYDGTGKIVQKGNIASAGNTYTLPLADSLPAGAYMVYITDNKNKVIVQESFIRSH
ncbi:MAG: T9SS C-terminal target domain-containing protein [Chitinophagia bacterium]|nr:T9SS C-terminal target domain-containing protein [Chitinophagia bacterium]